MINRVKDLIKRYSQLYQARPLPRQAITETEKKLKIILPDDFKEISKVFDSYETIGGHALFSFDPSVSGYNMVDKTLFYRGPTFGLPERYVALEETDTSFIVMETKVSPEEKTPIIYCSIPDAYNLAEEKPLQYKHHLFPSFADFFDYLLAEEEKERGLIPKEE